MQAKAQRDAVRAQVVRELRKLTPCPDTLRGLLEADRVATSELSEALALFEPIGAIVNGGIGVEL